MEIKDLEKMKTVIDDQIEVLKQAKHEAFLKGPHKSFAEGDWVTDGNAIGVVGWISNKYASIKEEDGYFGLNIKNGNGGFRAPCKRNDYELLEPEAIDYLTCEKTIKLAVTGEEIESFFMSYIGARHMNPSSLKDKLIDAFECAREDIL